MSAPPRDSDKKDDQAWIDHWLAPPLGDEVRKLYSALSSVQDASPYLTRVKRFVVDGPLRDELGISLYDETAWGVIRWNKSVGRPAAPDLAGGIGIVHEYDLTFQTEDHVIGDWVSAGAPMIWDAPDDEDTHAVSFMLRCNPQRMNRVTVTLTSGVPWHPIDKPTIAKRQRVLVYPASLALSKGEFNVSKGGAPVDLGIFQVVRTW